MYDNIQGMIIDHEILECISGSSTITFFKSVDKALKELIDTGATYKEIALAMGTAIAFVALFEKEEKWGTRHLSGILVSHYFSGFYEKLNIEDQREVTEHIKSIVLSTFPNDPPEKKHTHEERKKMTFKLRFKVFDRDGYRCQYCGRSASEGAKLCVDHIIPVSRGGKTTMDNLQTLCRECNASKAAQPESNRPPQRQYGDPINQPDAEQLERDE